MEPADERRSGALSLQSIGFKDFGLPVQCAQAVKLGEGCLALSSFNSIFVARQLLYRCERLSNHRLWHSASTICSMQLQDCPSDSMIDNQADAMRMSGKANSYGSTCAFCMLMIALWIFLSRGGCIHPAVCPSGHGEHYLVACLYIDFHAF